MNKDLMKSPNTYLTTDYLLSLLRAYQKPRHKIKKLVDHGELIHIRQGLYILGRDYQRPYSKEVLSGMIYGPSAISFEYALSYHGLIPERVESITCLCFKRKKHFETPIGNFDYRYIKKDLYPLMLDYHQTDLGNFFMASPEKAICDMVYFEKISGTDEAIDYLTNNLRIEPTELAKLNLMKFYELEHSYKRTSVKNIISAIKNIKTQFGE